jgi:hypothetical protein
LEEAVQVELVLLCYHAVHLVQIVFLALSHQQQVAVVAVEQQLFKMV